ncbi:MAG: aminotransferase class I/II-fold pyridoxal phosphate-dependent enzyme [Burkholderiales bacterium]|nr:aminotransferase class I/II-fold pyridoxal phosphate-dependent enzyme [Burkholderiales bacterium]
MRATLPPTGRPQADILADLRAMRRDDVDWKGGRSPAYMFQASEAITALGREAFLEYFSENALGAGRAFASVKRMETEVVEMALSLFQAPEGAAGFMTTGGTESLIQAAQTCRDYTRAARGDPRLNGNIVAADSVHPGFDKAARLMDLEVRRVPVTADFRADPRAMEAALDERTIMLVGSAPCYPFGVIDPITELGELATRRGLWLHVDACVGGYLAPFARMLGRDIPAFDFSVPGVASLSADLHKYGFCPKPASTVFYRTPEMARHHWFDFKDWPSGRFVTSTLVGTRPAGGVAGAWAVFQHLGIEGYKRVATDLFAFIDAYKARIRAMPGLSIVGEPHLAIVAYTAADIDIYRVAEEMSKNGWLPGLLRRPRAIHRMMSMPHAASVDAYFADLQAAIAVVRSSTAGDSTLQAQYGGR